MSEFNPRVSPEATDGFESQNDSPESELPSQDRLFDDFADRRQAYADELASAESMPGFKRTFTDIQNIRDIRAKVDALSQEWQRYGGTEVDEAQAAVDSLSSRSTFEDQAQAKRGLSDARDVFYENFRQEFEAHQEQSQPSPEVEPDSTEAPEADAPRADVANSSPEQTTDNTLQPEADAAETENHAEAPSDADREAAEAAAASANNPQNQHEAMPPEEIARAHELLSDSAQLRTEIKDVAAEAVSAAQRGVAHTLNGLSTPKNKYLEWRRDAAQEKYDRKAARQGTSMFKFVNKHYDKVAAKAQSKLRAKQSAYEGHSRMMDGRVANAEQRTIERRELGDKLRNKLMEDKIKAEERKLIRKEKAERRRQAKRSEQRLSYTERQAFVDTFTPQQKQQIRNAAIRAIKNRNR